MLNDNAPPDLLVVNLQGELVECHSPNDAAAVKTANEILANRKEFKYMPRELDRLAGVLTRYHCDAAAEKLSHMSSRMRAAHFLVDGVGHKPPAHHHEG